jgi:DNA-binding transcriptional ArsR family regulator
MDKFSALSDPSRRKIIEMLADHGPLSARDICEQFQMTPPAISQHLKILREADLVQVEKRAQQRIYRINPGAMLELEGWARQMTQLWSQRFERLDALLQVEKEELSQVPDGKDESNDHP